MDLELDILGGVDPEKEKWDALVEATIAGNVVPVVGPDILCDFGDGKNINEMIISTIASQLKLGGNFKSFSQLVYDPEFLPTLRRLLKKDNIKMEVIYSMVENIFKNPANVATYFKPSEALKRLLQTRLFPFVITTSFAPVVENEMKTVWGEDAVKVLAFRNNPDLDRKPGEGDISGPADMYRPTVYYMFGKVPGKASSFVLTDTDMLNFCHSWLSDDTRPRNLCAQLEGKYLLMLGCGYSDWLFRFIWFCMNKKHDSKTKGLMAHDENTHESLVEYLRRIDAFLPENNRPGEIVDEIVKRIDDYREEHPDAFRERVPLTGTDVFISYSRSDADVAKALYDYLTEEGLNVWYDRKNLAGGSKFMDEIERAIETTKVFVPIFTSNIAREAMDAHVYRHEWNKALEIQGSMGNRNFIVPINEEGFDFYGADIPKGLKNHNSLSYGPDRDFSAVRDAIKDALKKLEEWKG